MINEFKGIILDLVTKIRSTDSTVSFDTKVRLTFGLALIIFGISMIVFAILYGIVAFSLLLFN